MLLVVSEASEANRSARANSLPLRCCPGRRAARVKKRGFADHRFSRGWLTRAIPVPSLNSPRTCGKRVSGGRVDRNLQKPVKNPKGKPDADYGRFYTNDAYPFQLIYLVTKGKHFANPCLLRLFYIVGRMFALSVAIRQRVDYRPYSRLPAGSGWPAICSALQSKRGNALPAGRASGPRRSRQGS